MKYVHMALFTALLSPAVFAADRPAGAQVAVDTSKVSPPRVAQEVERKAGEGIDALRQYIERTRPIHQLDLRTILRDAPDADSTDTALASRAVRVPTGG